MTRLQRHPWLAQLPRFAGVGGLVAVLYLGLTAGLSALGVPFQASLATGYFLAVATQFLLHRHFTFATDAGFALTRGGQARRFALVALCQYATTAVLVAVLPGVLGVDRRIVWLCAVALIALGTFTILRLRLFHPPTR